MTTSRRSKPVAQPGPGQPLQLNLDLIDDDPEQPRKADNPGFSQASLEELAATIRLRGVKTPISVRRSPTSPNRYIINHGERRVRASRLAGKTVIPAFVDDDYNDIDQVIENLQRNQLTAREIADFIGRELAKGRKKGEIASSIGKSAAFVSQHAALLNLPEPVESAFNAGRLNDVTLITELMKCYRLAPAHVQGLLEDDSRDVSRRTVAQLREFLKQKMEADTPSPEVDADPMEDIDTWPETSAPVPRPHKQGTPVVHVMHKRRRATLLLNRPSTTAGSAWLRYEGESADIEIALSEVRLISLDWSPK